MAARDRSQPIPVKHWSRAGLMLTWWCNARCASCYLSCGPRRRGWMDVDDAARWWGELAAASPHGCRVHLTGGEPFGDYSRLLEVCRRAAREIPSDSGPLEKIETNAFWCTDEAVVRRRLAELDAAGMGRLVISADPYHQQYVPIERCRLVARVAEDVLGADRVQVRWRDWLAEGFDTGDLPESDRAELFARYAREGRDRLNGRAAELLTRGVRPGRRMEQFTDSLCHDALLRSKHVHVGPGGSVLAGTCAGIRLGDATAEPIDEIWRKLGEDWRERGVVGVLAREGPVGLARAAEQFGFEPDRTGGYRSKCHLCWTVRSHLVARGAFPAELGPAVIYAT